MIGDNLQAGQSCELHNIQCNIQQKSNEEEEVPGDKNSHHKSSSSSPSDASVIFCTYVQEMRHMQELSVKMSIQEHQAFDHNGSPYGLAPRLV